MNKRLLATILAVAALTATAPAYATTKADCAALAPSTKSMVDGTSGMYDALVDLKAPMLQVRAQFDGAELAALDKLRASRDALEPVLRAYVEAAEDYSTLIHRCAR